MEEGAAVQERRHKEGRQAEHGMKLRRNSSGKRESNADGWLLVETYER
jgi:hypothetical protein